MKITVLGNNGPFPTAGGACSGYLVQDGATKLLLDCGNGVLGNLQKFVRFEELDAVILSHLHSDHMSDMMVLRYAIQLKKKSGMIKDVLSVFAPAEPEEEYKRLDIKDAFNLKAITDELVLKFGNLKLTFSGMTHPFKDYAISIEDGSKRFVYSGDTSWDENIIAFSKGADLLMLDSGLLSKDKTDNNAPHLTARECGIIAGKAAVKKLLLTHIRPEYNPADLISEAKPEFEYVDVTKLMECYEI